MQAAHYRYREEIISLKVLFLLQINNNLREGIKD